MRTMGVFNLKTISKYFAATVYLAAIIKYFSAAGGKVRQGADNVLAVMFGPAWAIAICGLLVNNVFYKGIAKRDKTTLLGRRVGDIFGHVLPAVFVTMYAPDLIPMSSCTYTTIVVALFALLVPVLRQVYVGVPGWVLWGLAPFVVLFAAHAKYWPPHH